MFKKTLNKIIQTIVFIIGVVVSIFPIILALEYNNSSYILWITFSGLIGFLIFEFVDKIEI